MTELVDEVLTALLLEREAPEAGYLMERLVAGLDEANGAAGFDGEEVDPDFDSETKVDETGVHDEDEPVLVGETEDEEEFESDAAGETDEEEGVDSDSDEAEAEAEEDEEVKGKEEDEAEAAAETEEPDEDGGESKTGEEKTGGAIIGVGAVGVKAGGIEGASISLNVGFEAAGDGMATTVGIDKVDEVANLVDLYGLYLGL